MAFAQGARSRYSCTTFVKAAHLSEMRTRLKEAYTNKGKTPPSFLEPMPPGTIIRAVDITQLRQAVLDLWNMI